MRTKRPTVEPGLEPPWWLQEAAAAEGGGEVSPPLAGDRAVDAAVVGGGYTGLWTALALRERDPSLEVVVLEAAACGEGPSGRNGGFLHGYWSSLPRLRAALGDEEALALARAGDRIVPAVRAFAAERGADVWLRESGMLKVSAAPAQDAAVERSVTAAAELGVPEEAVPLEPEEVASRLRSPVLRRGVLFRDGATVQPARLVRALRRAVLDAGVALHERTPVLRGRRGDPTVLETPGGTVRAGAVVLAINAGAAGWGPASARLTSFGSYVVLTEPVPHLLERIGWTGGEAVVDGRMFLHYFRTTPDGRVLMGSGSGPIAGGRRFDARSDPRLHRDGSSVARAEAGLRRLLPEFDSARVSHAWGGPIDVASDGLPFVATLPGHRFHYAAGFSGNGVGPSWLVAQALASLAAGCEDEWTALPLVGRRPPRLPPEPLKRVGGRVVRGAALRVEEAEEEGRRGPLPLRAAAALPRLLRVPLGTR